MLKILERLSVVVKDLCHVTFSENLTMERTTWRVSTCLSSPILVGIFRVLGKVSAEKLVHLQVTVEALNCAGILDLRANEYLVRYRVQQVK